MERAGQQQAATRLSFAEVSAITPATLGAFAARVSPEWTIAGKPNGGYLLAMMCRAATSVTPHADVIAASAHFLHSPDPGPVAITAEVLRTGRSASQARVRMTQDGRPCVEALVTTAALDADAKPFWEHTAPGPVIAGYDDCAAVPALMPGGARVAIMEQAEVRLDPACTGFTRGAPGGTGELYGWLALPRDGQFDPVSLVYAVDSFPPATLEVASSGWVPTLELTVYVRALPAPGPVRVLQRARLIDDQRVDEECRVWDSTGRLVAHGTQLAAIRLQTPAP